MQRYFYQNFVIRSVSAANFSIFEICVLDLTRSYRFRRNPRVTLGDLPSLVIHTAHMVHCLFLFLFAHQLIECSLYVKYIIKYVCFPLNGTYQSSIPAKMDCTTLHCKEILLFRKSKLKHFRIFIIHSSNFKYSVNA